MWKMMFERESIPRESAPADPSEFHLKPIAHMDNATATTVCLRIRA
jgi:hypothetical protein